MPYSSSSSEKEIAESMFRVILHQLISDAGLPAQIVDIPDEDIAHSSLTIVINKDTASILDTLAKEFGTTRQGVARSVLHAFATYIYKSID